MAKSKPKPKRRYLIKVSGAEEGRNFAAFEVKAETEAEARRLGIRMAKTSAISVKRIESPGVLATIGYFLAKAFSPAEK